MVQSMLEKSCDYENEGKAGEAASSLFPFELNWGQKLTQVCVTFGGRVACGRAMEQLSTKL